MRTQLALQTLTDYQARINAQLDASGLLLAAGAEAGREGLAKVRWNITRVMREYQLFKHGEIFDPAILRGSVVQAAIARRMKAACVAAGDRYAAHVARWSAGDATEDWAAYTAAVKAIVADIRTHLARERRDVERFLAGSDRTRRLALPPAAKPTS